MSTGSKVPEARNLFKQIMAEPERMFELVHMDLKEQCERVVNELLKAELTEFLKRAPYERQNGDKEKRNYRNGSCKRTYSKALLGTAVSPTEVSRISAELAVAIEEWRLRDFSTFDVKYLIVDGVLIPDEEER